ncbi:MAG: COG1361 S-layer family protein [Natronomonas sp.]
MNRSHVILLLFVLGTVIAAPALANTTGEPNLSVKISENRVSAGEATELTVSLQNRGVVDRSSSAELDQRVTNARGVDVELDEENAPIEVRTTEQSVGSIADGAATSADFEIVVDENADPGEYDVSVRYEYEYYDRVDPGSGYSDTKKIDRKRVTIEVVDEPRFEISDVESGVAVGDSGTATVNVTNVGSQDASDATVSISSDSNSITFDGQETASSFVEAWETDESRTLSFDVDVDSGADERTYRLTGSVEFEDEDGQDGESEDLAFGLEPAGEQAFAIESVESDLRVGDDGTVRGQLENTGETTAYNVVASLEAGSETIDVLEPRFAVGTLEAGESARVEYDVDVSDSARGGPRQFTLEPEYRNAADDKRTGDPIDLTANVDSKLDEFGVEPLEATMEAGSDGELVLSVTNDRSETFTDISAKLFVESPISVSDDEAYISELEPGETGEIAFAVGVDGSTMEKPYPVEVDFRYEDSDGDDRISDTYTVPIDVVSPEDDSSSTLLLVLGAVIVLVGAGYMYYRRR